MSDYKKRPRADKYDAKLKINASFEDAMGVLLGKKVKSNKMTITNEWSDPVEISFTKGIELSFSKAGIEIKLDESAEFVEGKAGSADIIRAKTDLWRIEETIDYPDNKYFHPKEKLSLVNSPAFISFKAQKDEEIQIEFKGI